MDNDYYVTASELSEFVFCKRGWWLRRNGLIKETEAMSRGTQKHKQLAATVEKNPRLRQTAFIIITIGSLLMLSALLLTFLR